MATAQTPAATADAGFRDHARRFAATCLRAAREALEASGDLAEGASYAQVQEAVDKLTEGERQ